MLKRNKQRESEFEEQLGNNLGKIVNFRYEISRGKEKKVVSKTIIGKIGKLEKDFKTSYHGNCVYIERMDENKKLDGKLLDCIDKTIEKSEEFRIIGEEKPKNYTEKYYIRKISDLKIF
jgi:hypothetical protein